RPPRRPDGALAHPAPHPRARSHPRAPRRPPRRGRAPALPRARPGTGGLRRGGPLARGADRRRLRPRRGRARDRDDRPRRVQAPPGAAGSEAAAEGVRPRPADADHEQVARLGLLAVGLLTALLPAAAGAQTRPAGKIVFSVFAGLPAFQGDERCEGLYAVNADGTGLARLAGYAHGSGAFYPEFSANGRMLSFGTTHAHRVT